jgi:hypothetical protein
MKSIQILARPFNDQIGEKSRGLRTGWDIPGEPGNWVPRNSLDLRRNILQESRLSHDIYKRKK